MPESSLEATLAFRCPVDEVDVTDEGVADLLNESELILSNLIYRLRLNYLEESWPRVRPRLAGAALPPGTVVVVRVAPWLWTDLLLLRLGVHVRFSAIRARLIHSSYRVFQPV